MTACAAFGQPDNLPLGPGKVLKVEASYRAAFGDHTPVTLTSPYTFNFPNTSSLTDTRISLEVPATLSEGLIAGNGRQIRLNTPFTSGARVTAINGSGGLIRIFMGGGCSKEDPNNFTRNAPRDVSLTCTAPTVGVAVPDGYDKTVQGQWFVTIQFPNAAEFAATVTYEFPVLLTDSIVIQSVKPDPAEGVAPGRNTFTAAISYSTQQDTTLLLRLYEELPTGLRLRAASPRVRISQGKGTSAVEIRDFDVPPDIGTLILKGGFIGVAGSDFVPPYVESEGVRIALADPRRVPPNPYPPRQSTDTRFVVTRGTGIRTPCLTRAEGPLEIQVDVSRVVGDVDGKGILEDFNTLLRSKTLSEYALLRVASFGRRLQGNSSRSDKVLLNGETFWTYEPTTDALTGPDSQWSVTNIRVPIQFLRFPARVVGQKVNPQTNTLTIRIDDAAAAGSSWCSSVDWVELSFNAMAPVIMVHGNGQGDDNKGGEFWEGRVLDTPETGRVQMASFVAQAFREQGFLFDNTISMLTDTIEAHGVLLKDLIPARAAEFGSRRVHLLAHSKGGLDSREFLARRLPPNFGVLSIVTLSTPHQGSPGPDYQIDATKASMTYADDSIRAFIGYMSPPNPGTESLRVANARLFNARNVPLLPKQVTVDGETFPVAYRAFSGDMNSDDSKNLFTGNPTITIFETYGLPGQGSKPTSLWESILQTAYRITGNVVETYVETVETTDDRGNPMTLKLLREKLHTQFQPNDIAVTREAAKVGPFLEVEHVKANHSTIASRELGLKVLDTLREVQPIKPPEEQ